MAETLPDHHSSSADKDVFKDIYFSIIPTKDLSNEKIEELIKDLTTHGATHCPLSSSELRHVTHLIATTSDFPAYHDAVESFIHVVKPLWVIQSIYKNKTANPRQFSPDPCFFLSDVVLTCADDIPEGDKDAIIGGLHSMGGQYSPGLTKLVTHVVALTMDNPQCKTIVDRNLECKPVLPHWFDDCLKLGKKISCAPYILPKPPILSGTEVKPPFGQSVSNDLLGATLLTPPPLSESRLLLASPSKERRELAVFQNKAVFLHRDLQLSSRITQSITDIVTQGGGSITKDVDESDMLVCQFRNSKEFVEASQAGKDVGNLSWLYYLINQNGWTSPTRRLLHYPFPKNGIDGFGGFKISVSNYTGEARIYLENLVKAAGGDYTKSMAQENTHLITAHTFSEKCTAAKEWNIHMVNHLWLEESYARCRIQSMTNPKYTTFPQRTNLCEVVGQTPIDRQAVERLHFPRGNEELTSGKVETLEANPLAVAHTPAKKAAKHDGGKKPIQTPIALRLNGDAVPTPGSRGAKDRALAKLHSMAPDIALFEKEVKRVGGVVYGGRKVTDPDRIMLNSAPQGRKRLSNDLDRETAETAPDGIDADRDEEPEHVAAPQKKKSKSSRQVSVTSEPLLKVLVTGYDKDGIKATANIKAKLSGLNINIIEDPTADIDVLVAPRIMRTRKFLIGVAAAPAVVDVSWLEHMATQQKRLPLEAYLLHDPDTEKSAGINLKDAMERAKRNKEKGGMLNGQIIYCTDFVKGGFETYESIIKANGGTCLLFKGRLTTIPDIRKMKHKQQNDGDWEMIDANDDEPTSDENATMENAATAENQAPPHLYLITDVKDKEKVLWHRFKEQARKEGFGTRLVKPDWLLRIAQSQIRNDWLDEWEYTS